MATLIENAVKGQRSAINTLYDANKQKVYFIAQCLLGEQEQAANAAMTVFKEAWANLESAVIATEEQFTNYVVCRVLDYCKGKLLKRNPKALRVPIGKDFLVPTHLTVRDSADTELEYVLKNLPHTQKYIFVMHTAGCMEVMQIARVLKFDSKTVRTAIEAEAENMKRLLAMSGKGHACSYEDILEDIKQAEADAVVPSYVDEQMTAIINAIATPAEEKEKKRKYTISVLSALIGACVVIALLIFCLTSDTFHTSPNGEESSPTTTNTAEPTDEAEEPTDEAEKPTESEETEATESGDVDSNALDENLLYYADIAIADYGTITVQLDQASAPITCANFVGLAESGFYDGLTFHRIMAGFMMQGGDPEGNGTGGSDETIVGEFPDNGYDNNLTHTRGAISMARSSDYDSASSQFFIVQEDSNHLDGQYAVFGYVTEGMDVVDAVCDAAEPTDSNGTISAEDQPVITSIIIRTEAVQ